MDSRIELLAALQADIAARLRPVCPGMSEERFEELVRDIAAVKVKYGLDEETATSLKERLAGLLHENQHAQGKTNGLSGA